MVVDGSDERLLVVVVPEDGDWGKDLGNQTWLP